LAIVLLATAMAGGNLLFQRWSSHRALEFWGTEAVETIRNAADVEVFKLAFDTSAKRDERDGTSNGATLGRLAIGGTEVPIAKVAVVSHADPAKPRARGLMHVRRELVFDSLYDWEAPPGNHNNHPPDKRPSDDGPTAWAYAIRFTGPKNDGALVIVLDRSCRVLAVASDPTRRLAIRSNEDGASPLAAFIQEQFAEDDATPVE